MSEAQLPRPRPVTYAGVVAASACVLLVMSLFDQMVAVRSVETRDALTEALGRPPLSGTGIGVAQALDFLHALVLLTGALGAAGAILAVYVLRRHRGARIGLTVVAVLMLFTAIFVSDFLPIVVAVATAMLWSREARAWFDGRVLERAVPAAPAPGGGQQARPFAPTTETRSDPRVIPGDPSSQQGSWPAPHPGYGQHRQPTALDERPGTVTVAAVLTWVLATVALGFFALVLLLVMVDRDTLLAELQRNETIADRNLSARDLLGALWTFGAIGVFWSLSAIVLAILVYRRVQLARAVLLVSCGATVVVGVVTVAGLAHALAAVAVLVLLLGPRANAWFRSAGTTPRPPAGPPPGWRPPQQSTQQQPTQQRGPKPPVW